MKLDEVRAIYLEYFKRPPRSHKEIPAAPLVLEGDPTTLFTSSGMQPLVPYLMGEDHPLGDRLVNSQPSIRLQDFEEVGDNRHTTFFEMLGNWSLGDYFKEEQLRWFWEFLTKKLKLDSKKLYATIYKGSPKLNIPKDEDSEKIWKDIYKKAGIKAKVVDDPEQGMQDGRIFYYEDNWWSRSGPPNEMPAGEIGGPDSEVFYDFGEELGLHAKSQYKDEQCHPNCDCGRFMEIGNSVFMQYKKTDDGKLEELPNKNVDFGGGLLRLTAATLNSPDVFMVDVFQPAIKKLQILTQSSYGKKTDADRSYRIIVDHVRAAVMLADGGIRPGNKLQGYVLRRLIRRSVFHLIKLTNMQNDQIDMAEIAGTFQEYYPQLKKNWPGISQVINEEARKFQKALERGMRKLRKALDEDEQIGGEFVFDLYQTEGFPPELTLEIIETEGREYTKADKEKFEKEFEEHKEKSRQAAKGMFKGGLADGSDKTTKLHTATHLLHESLRRILGEHVEQKGSHITAERLRFDFTHPQKLTEEELKEVEDMINEQIGKDLKVVHYSTELDEAKASGALAFFGERYGEKVTVYSIGGFSKEVCGGPHVDSTGDLSHVKITKEESVGAGVRRIYAAFD